MEKVEDREIVVNFHADKHASMRWNFQPQQKSVKVSTHHIHNYFLMK